MPRCGKFLSRADRVSALRHNEEWLRLIYSDCLPLTQQYNVAPRLIGEKHHVHALRLAIVLTKERAEMS